MKNPKLGSSSTFSGNFGDPKKQQNGIVNNEELHEMLQKDPDIVTAFDLNESLL